jgi:dTDP-glucose 4,6-dehydratase
MKRKILVTGGSGFIGSHLVKELIKKNFAVAITTKYESLYDNIRLKEVWEEIEIIECDITYSSNIKKIKKYKPEIIFHLAAYNDVKGSFNNYEDSLLSNATGTANLLENLDKFSQFIYVSTSEIYGEQDTGIFRENLKPNPISPYSIGKYSGEMYAAMHMKFYNKPIKIIRPFNVFGSYQSAKAVIPELILKFLKNETVKITKGKQTREFNYVNNTVKYFLKVLDNNKCFNKTINISDGHEINIENLAKKIKYLTNSNSKIIVGGLKERNSEIKKMSSSNVLRNKILGRIKKISFENGLIETIKWHRDFYNLYK